MLMVQTIKVQVDDVLCSQVHSHHHRLQLSAEQDKERLRLILGGGVMLFIMPKSLHECLSCENAPLGKHCDIHHSLFAPLMGHNWLKCVDMRGSWKVLNHQRFLKQPHHYIIQYETPCLEGGTWPFPPEPDLYHSISDIIIEDIKHK